MLRGGGSLYGDAAVLSALSVSSCDTLDVCGTDEGAGARLGREAVSFPRGSVVLVDLDPTVGHERRGTRRCVVVSDPEVIGALSLPLLGVVPITGTGGSGALYPALSAGPSGLVKPSCALVGQARSVDKRRVQRRDGRVSPDELARIDDGIRPFLGLG